jgi:hypothetical protein
MKGLREKYLQHIAENNPVKGKFITSEDMKKFC